MTRKKGAAKEGKEKREGLRQLGRGFRSGDMPADRRGGNILNIEGKKPRGGKTSFLGRGDISLFPPILRREPEGRGPSVQELPISRNSRSLP